jgi:hypothetical protein
MMVVGTDRVERAGDAVLVTARKASSGIWDGVPLHGRRMDQRGLRPHRWTLALRAQSDNGGRPVISSNYDPERAGQAGPALR